MTIDHSPEPQADIRLLLATLAIWGMAVATAAQTGLYGRLYPPLLAPLVALGIFVPIAIYAASAPFRRTIAAIGLRRLTLLHVWRIPAAIVFFWYGSQGLLPETFVRNAAWGDLIAGIFALVVSILPESRNRYLAFHIFGFADFVLAVATGLTLTLQGDPRMAAIQTLPLALIPLYGVGISGATHIMAFHLLRRSRNATVAEGA